MELRKQQKVAAPCLDLPGTKVDFIIIPLPGHLLVLLIVEFFFGQLDVLWWGKRLGLLDGCFDRVLPDGGGR